MSVIEDPVIGRITVRRTSSSSMRISLAPNGSIRVSAPKLMPMFLIKRSIVASRDKIIDLKSKNKGRLYSNGSIIGKKHILETRRSQRLHITSRGIRIMVSLGAEDDIASTHVQDAVKPFVIKALRREAKEYLSKRITLLASQQGFEYSSLKYTHSSGRWGSCNSKKAISLNIALMTLPYELIDYVLIHELAHTIHLNHSKSFWNEVRRCIPDFESRRKALKRYSPTV